MTVARRHPGLWFRPHTLTAWTLACWLAGAGLAFADEPPGTAWHALRAATLQALTGLSRTSLCPPAIPETTPASECAAAYGDATRHADRPNILVVGFTGGLEGSESRVSGVVRMRKRIEESAGLYPGVSALTYNNRDWRAAVREALSLIGGREDAAARGADIVPAPLIIVYGHSWGGGAVSKFARALRDERLEVSLAVYIDAFSWRNPRVPDNVRYAVNFYQRTGILRGFPLRGKSKLVLESPESTVLLGNLRITPDTEHFGWHWNIVQPMLYRHHHRMGHDVRLQQYLLDLVTLHATNEHAD